MHTKNNGEPYHKNISTLHTGKSFVILCLILILFITALIGTGIWIGRRLSETHGKKSFTAKTIAYTIEDMSELITTHYKYSGVGKFEAPPDTLVGDIHVPFTGKSFIIAYEGEMSIGTDFSNPDIQIDKDQKYITISLPPVQILSHSINEQSFEIWDEKDSIFNPITLEDYSSFVSSEKIIQENNAIKSGVLEQEKKQAVSAIQKLVNTEHSDYTVEVIFRETQETPSQITE